MCIRDRSRARHRRARRARRRAARVQTGRRGGGDKPLHLGHNPRRKKPGALRGPRATQPTRRWGTQ
eukprot:4585462-Prymnesium_polylepis.1